MSVNVGLKTEIILYKRNFVLIDINLTVSWNIQSILIFNVITNNFGGLKPLKYVMGSLLTFDKSKFELQLNFYCDITGRGLIINVH